MSDHRQPRTNGAFAPFVVGGSEADDQPAPFGLFDHCSECGLEDFIDGPRGGAAINIFCAHCGAGYNVLRLPAPRHDIRLMRFCQAVPILGGSFCLYGLAGFPPLWLTVVFLVGLALNIVALVSIERTRRRALRPAMVLLHPIARRN